MTNKSLFIVGCGYLGTEVAKLWSQAGLSVQTTTRSQEKAKALSAIGVQASVADINESWPTLSSIDAILFCSGFDGENRISTYLERVRRSCQSAETFTPFIYIGSTGVYSENDGGIVTEESATGPTRETAQACLDAERIVQDNQTNHCILRLAGIYGPNRIPRQRMPPNDSRTEDSYLNLIHVEDAAHVVVAALNQNLSGTYNLSDGSPVLVSEYDSYLQNTKTKVTGKKISGKRVSTSKLNAVLNYQLKFPTWKHGLNQLI